MSTKVVIGVFCGFALVIQVSAQEVAIGREGTANTPEADAAMIKEILDEVRPQKAVAVQPVKPAVPEVKPGVAKPATAAQAPAQKPAPASQTVTVAKPSADKPATTAQLPAQKPPTVPQTASVSTVKPGVEKPLTTAQIPAQKTAPAPQTPTVEIGTAKVATSPAVKPAKPEVPPPVQAVDVSPAVTKPVAPGAPALKPAAPAIATSVPNKPAAPAIVSSAPGKPATPPVVSSAPTKLATPPVASSVPSKPATAPVVLPKKPATAVSVGSAPAKLNRDAEKFLAPPLNLTGATAFTKLANGFDFPVGKPDAKNYYKARGFQGRSHLGEDWGGTGGGDTDMGDPIYCIGDGVVVFARDCHQGWGNVVIVRHAYREGGSVRNIDSLYAHCQKILVRRGQSVTRGQQIATIGNAHGLYDAHLHFEIRKNLTIGMSRNKFAKDLSNYADPTQFIASHRNLPSTGGNWRIAMNTFTYDERIRWDKLRNYRTARSGGSSSQSARNLKKALAAQSVSARAN